MIEVTFDKDNNITNEKEYCKGFVQEFLKDKDFSTLKNLSFGTLSGDVVFGSKGDADCGELVKVLQFMSFKNILESKNLKDINQIDLKLKGEVIDARYPNPKRVKHTIFFNGYPLDSGDTLNTFATLFSNPCEYSFELKMTGGYEVDIIKRKLTRKGETLPDYLLENFYNNYLKIGNFMLLPKGDYKELSLNQYRAQWKDRSGWYDYFDLFLKHIRIWYNDNNDKNLPKTFKNLMTKPHNYNFFHAFKTFDNFVKFNSLEHFFENADSNDKLKQLRLDDNKKYYHWINFEDNKTKDTVSFQEYKEFACNYVNVGIKIINERSNQIIDNCAKF